MQLLPLSIAELAADGRLADQPGSLDAFLLRGGYPALHARAVAPARWYADYTMSYLERDARQITQVHDLSAFQRFLRLCAGRTGQLLNLSALAVEAGISQSTARAWLSVLEASYIVFLLQPHHRNLGKRLVKTPKLYFIDTGLAASLLGLQEAGQLATHPLRGALFETLIVGEFLKARYNAGWPSNLYFWRDNTGLEVDLLLETPEALLPVEIKATATVRDELFAGLRKWQAIAGNSAGPARLVCAAPESHRRHGVAVRRWQDAAS